MHVSWLHDQLAENHLVVCRSPEIAPQAHSSVSLQEMIWLDPLSGVQMQIRPTFASLLREAAAPARASSASSSTIGQTFTPIACSASSSKGNCDMSRGSTPSPVLYLGQRLFRNDSMTWSVATPM